MKIKEGFLLKNVAGINVVAAVDRNIEFDGIISLNDPGVLLFKMLLNGADIEELVQAMLKEYDVDRETALNDINSFIKKLDDAGVIEK